jgi:hypothetical protein
MTPSKAQYIILRDWNTNTYSIGEEKLNVIPAKHSAKGEVTVPVITYVASSLRLFVWRNARLVVQSAN